MGLFYSIHFTEKRLRVFLFIFSFRLWHQLTKKLFEFFDFPAALPYRVDVFERFVRDFENKINKLRLAEMGVKVAKDIDSAFSVSAYSLFNNYG